MKKIKIGQIVNAVGLKGEVKLYHYTDYKERFEELGTIYVDDKKTTIEHVRYLKDLPILKLDGCNDRNTAESLKGKTVYISEDQLRELPEDTYYIRDLIGLPVKDEKDIFFGTLKDVLQNSAQDLYEIELEQEKTILLPAVSEFVLDINLEEKYIKVKLIDGILDV
ncbi:ribosome maturation factor RimM [Clostridium aminobutyricum]|uniref:Ribosome maturation factor RimM n=1 Tax=Clostridium aminobutyricum TaxID=33953 RepID=A0A939D6S4_CLOAM|nr:ribosome maturation factor RimM [Clostridium aminobutyricum]MBN7772096.1 16S rRNA processing protein RimM [Clostridium aminobutyricum]